jgi:hypothetical protein
MFMIAELTIAASVFALGQGFFRNFQGETPRATTFKKWLVYFALVFLLELTVGRPWSFIWTFLPVVGMVGHFAWCFRHGIHPLTAEPRDRYYALRGWSLPKTDSPET